MGSFVPFVVGQFPLKNLTIYGNRIRILPIFFFRTTKFNKVNKRMVRNLISDYLGQCLSFLLCSFCPFCGSLISPKKSAF
ncbi:hypothetical protein EF405_02060 [Cyclobacteriaceae bacterium YHN15]|nr:hypothetical protein EF405_02055 [Cyclobacteriaceae bacterium YHN15]RPA70094.1 hypothetical protein EF405_02060 [Cyclobacteriaceae bacterium YHN15]